MLSFPPPLLPPVQCWPLEACKTLLKERIGLVLEDALMLDDCDTVGGELTVLAEVLAAFQHAHGPHEHSNSF